MAKNKTNRPAGRTRGEHSESAASPRSRRAAVRAEGQPTGERKRTRARRVEDGHGSHPAATPESGTLQLFFSQAARHPLLTAAQEVDLAKRIERGDLEAKEQMVNSNLRLVISNARKYQNLGLPLTDLIQEGVLGLIRAARSSTGGGDSSSRPTPRSGSGSRCSGRWRTRPGRSGSRSTSSSASARWPRLSAS